MSLEIESADVIRLIQQFLKENNLLRTLETIQDETTITLNTVESIDSFTDDIIQGRWDVVLKTVSQLNLPNKKLIDLYEQIVLELIELRELSAARSLLRQTDPMQLLRDNYPERYLHLEHLLSRTFFDIKDAYPEGVNKHSRRSAIAQSLASEVTVVPPSRLLTLLGHSLKWQQNQGLLPLDSGYDLFRGSAPTIKSEEDEIPRNCFNTIKFPKKQHPECAIFSPDGQYLITGSADGFIEIWNYLTGKLRKDLKYQAEEKLMLMDSAILSLSCSSTSELLVSGAQNGQIKVWKISTGQCLRRFENAHTNGVTCVRFDNSAGKVVSGGFDGVVRIHGLKSGKMLKEFRGHSSFVNSVAYTIDGSRIISGSSDGTVRIWDSKTTDCLSTIFPSSEGGGQGGIGKTVNTVVPLKTNPDQFLVCDKSSVVRLMNMRGQIVRSYTQNSEAPTSKLSDLISAIFSPKHEFIYALSENGELHCWRQQSGIEVTVKTHESGEVIGFSHHPFSNIVATWADDGQLLLWKS
ncbi:WD40 repeat-containing protein SMU1-like protein [Paraphysoderma sedebokerense]|nr:WD40 repeat-containing protein SMU1-like protein [Paraphysoderma sedebokerense]